MAKLLVKDGDHTYLIDLAAGESLVLGRSHDCDVPIEARRASRRHVRFEAHGDGHRVADLGSTNGTLLNGAPFAHETGLSDRDVIDAGGCVIVYRVDPS